MVKCPRCGSNKVWKNGYVIRRHVPENFKDHRVQRYQCVNCGYVFTELQIRKTDSEQKAANAT